MSDRLVPHLWRHLRGKPILRDSAARAAETPKNRRIETLPGSCRAAQSKLRRVSDRRSDVFCSDKQCKFFARGQWIGPLRRAQIVHAFYLR